MKNTKPDCMSIGVLVQEANTADRCSFYGMLFQKVVLEAAGQECLTMLEIVPKASEQECVLPRCLSNEGIQGLLVIGTWEQPYLQNILQQAEIPLVLLDESDAFYACDAILPENYFGMYQATRHLIDMGHQNIGFVRPASTAPCVLDRYFGWRCALEEAGLAVREEWILDSEELPAGKRRRSFPKGGPLPTAFAASDRKAALWLARILEKRGLSIPEDIAVVSVSYDGNLLPGQLASYRLDLEAMARRAVRVLSKKIRFGDNYSGIRFVDGRLEKRG